jgi:transposase
MKEQGLKEKFQQYRAEGLSFDKISKTLKVSKPTLIRWGKMYKKQIGKLKAIRYEQILEKYKASREDRIERIAKELQSAWKIYESKDYNDLSKKQIFYLILQLEKRLKEETEPILNPKRTEEDEQAEKYQIDTQKISFDKDFITGEITEWEEPLERKIIIYRKKNLLDKK